MTNKSFTWDEVKDSFIPFLQVLQQNYEIYSFDYNGNPNIEIKPANGIAERSSGKVNAARVYCDIEDVIEDKFTMDRPIQYISIIVNNMLNYKKSKLE